MVVLLLLLGLLVWATITDLRRHKIFNVTTYPGIVVAMVLNGAGSVLVWLEWSEPESLSQWGWIGFGQSVAGFALCGFVMLLCYVFFRLGGGDVKLLAMVGSFLGPERGLEALLWTFVLGGAVGLIVLIWSVGPVPLAIHLGKRLGHAVRLRRFEPLSADEKAALQPRLFLAPSALAAVLMVLLWPNIQSIA